MCGKAINKISSHSEIFVPHCVVWTLHATVVSLHSRRACLVSKQSTNYKNVQTTTMQFNLLVRARNCCFFRWFQSRMGILYASSPSDIVYSMLLLLDLNGQKCTFHTTNASLINSRFSLSLIPSIFLFDLLPPQQRIVVSV